MENRKFIKLLIPIFVLGFFVSNSVVFAYDTETHAYLTSEIINFYNQHFTNNQISKELIPYFLDGSRREDDIPRWMNHFYDPVYNRGLTNSVLGTWQKSKDWAQDSNNQNSLTYKVPATIASILTAIQEQRISAISTYTNFTWQEAIKLYAQDQKEKAMFMLGHILHLIEDSSVPDHTRNDPHLGSSYYENHARQFTINNPDKNFSIRLIIKQPIALNNLASYFDELAGYSNNNFYSRDTIGIQSGYKTPEPVEYEKINDILFSLGKDNMGLYKLSVQPIQSSVLINIKGEVTIDDNRVLQDYWSRLSTKSVQYGTGVINLFFQEIEKAKNDPNFAKTEEKSIFAKAFEVTKNLFSQIGNFFSGIFGGGQDFQEVGQVTLEQPGDAQPPQVENQYPKNETPKTDIESQKVNQQNQLLEEDEEIPQQIEEQTEQQKQTQQATSSLQQTTSFKQCSFQTNQSPSRQKVIINEVAWMGTTASANDEWIELKNISSSELNLNGWQLIDKGEQIKVVFGQEDNRKIINKNISASGFYLLERTDDNSVPTVTADFVYTGILSNSDEGLRLFDQNCNLIDEVLANSGSDGKQWPAGDNATKQTMERKNDLSWQTSASADGTPKTANSSGYVSYGGGGGGTPTNTQNQVQYPKILINEIQISPIENRFIELYNPNDFSVDLTNWSIKKKTSSGTEYSLLSSSRLEGKSILPKSYFLLANEEGYSGDIIPDVFWAKSNTISKDNTIILYDGNQKSVDKVGFGLAADCEGNCALNPNVDQKSIQRKFQDNAFIDTDNNAVDFEIQNCPSPKAQSKNCSAANQAPSAFFIYTPQNPQAGDLITFDATSSTDPDPDGQIISYQWNFSDNATSSISTTTTTHSYSIAGTYSVSLIVFDNQNVSSVATSTVISINSPQSSNVNHLVISEIMAGITGSPDNEFIELYNPTNNAVNLSDWSLKRKTSQTATSTENLVLNFNTTSIIAAKSFFLVVHNNYNGSTTPDFRYTNNSNPLSYNNDVVILKDNAGLIVDEVVYIEIPANKSLERKAFSGGVCVSAQNDGEFLGNGCDTDSDSDFEIRDIPNPQNSQSFPEPRNAPTSPVDFTIQYSTSTMELIFNWTPSQDYSGTTSTITYKITDISNASSTLSTIETASTTAKISINEIGRQYNFSIQALDREGLGSTTSTSSSTVPSFFSSLYFYQDPRDNNKILIEAYYNQYPFIPDLFNQNKWQLIIFYLNRNNPPPLDELANELAIKYKQCAGGTQTGSLILPVSSNYCGTSGGAYSQALDFSELEDNHFIIQTANSSQDLNLTNQNYLTVAFYTTYNTQTFDGRVPYFQLVAVDKTKYHFQNQLPPHQKPIPPANLQFSLNQTKSTLTVSWNNFVDPDTLDNLLRYEVSYNNENWRAASNWLFDEAVVESNKTYNIRVRAFDDFGLESDILTDSFTTPEISSPFSISKIKIKWGRLANSLETQLRINYSNDALPDMIIFYLNQLPPLNYGPYYSGLDTIVLSPNAPSPYYGYRLIGHYYNYPELASYYPYRVFRLTADKNDISLPITALVGTNLNKTLNDLIVDDFITLGFYNIDPWGNIVPINNDAHKYYFQILEP